MLKLSVFCVILCCCLAHEAFRLPMIEYWYFRVDDVLTQHNCDPLYFGVVKDHVLMELQRYQLINSHPISVDDSSPMDCCSIALNSRIALYDNDKYCRYALYPDVNRIHTISSYEASNILLQASIMSHYPDINRSVSTKDLMDKPIFFVPSPTNDHNKYYTNNPLIDINSLFAEYKAMHRPDIVGPDGVGSDIYSVAWNYPSKLPAFIRNNKKRRIIIYQSRGVYTGGTIALEDVYKTLLRLGYEDESSVVMCHDDNFDAEVCSSAFITDNDIVITGEWCGAVLRDFNITTDPHRYGVDVVKTRRELVQFNASGQTGNSLFHYRGRGMQYHLGFHHASNFCSVLNECRGHIVVSDDHHLHTSLGNKIMGNYFIGCPMTESIKKAFVEMMMDQQFVNTDSASIAHRISVRKENLIIIDSDIWKDYPTASSIPFRIPSGYKVVYLSNIPHQQIPLLLQRAKVIIDLALPGPERISSEGILFGVLPLLSNRWTGASHIDFPVNATLNKANHLDATEITNKLQYLVDNYESLLVENIENSRFFNYIVSMWRRHHHTMDIMIGSSHFHFIIISASSTVEDEIRSNYQILSILFLFPMASIDLYVDDVVWFYRHHYKFLTLLKEAGYIRYDPMDPGDFEVHREELNLQSLKDTSDLHAVHRSFVQIRSKESLDIQLSHLGGGEGALRETTLIPSWEPIAVLLPSGYVFNTSMHLISHSSFLGSPTHVINIHSHLGELHLSTLLLSPETPQGIAYNWLIGTVEDPMESHSHHIYHNDVVSICSVLQDHGRSEGNDLLMDPITNSLPWITYSHFIQNNKGIDISLGC